MKKLALISSYCDNEKKLNLLYTNIVKLKNLGIDVLIYTPIILPEYILQISNYVIFSEENPILHWPEKAYLGWTSFNCSDKTILFNVIYSDHGYACLNQFKKMGIYGLSMDYDIYYPIIYDLDINDFIYESINKNLINSFFPSRRGSYIWVVGLHFSSLDAQHLKNFVNSISKESYLDNLHGDAFSWLMSKINSYDCNIESNPVDELYTIEDEFDRYNLSLFEDIKFFIQKNDLDNIKIFFYGFYDVKKIKITTDFFHQDYEVSNCQMIELNEKKINKFIISYEGTEIDHTDVLNKIVHNTIEIK